MFEMNQKLSGILKGVVRVDNQILINQAYCSVNEAVRTADNRDSVLMSRVRKPDARQISQTSAAS